MQEAADQMRAWLRELLNRLNETPTGLARRAGVAQSTLTRFLDDNGPGMLSPRTIAKISHATGTPAPGMPAGTPAHRGMSEEEAAPYRPEDRDPIKDAIVALCVDRPSADPWTLRTSHLVEEGLLPGDILLVDLAEDPRSGDVVCAQIYDWRTNRAETVFRIYEPPYLVAATRDRRERRPHVVDGERAVIKGVAFAMIRPLTPRD